MPHPRYEAFREYQVVILGAGAVGKSCLAARFIHDEWIERCDPSITNSYQKQLAVDGRQVVLEILDTAGTEQFTSKRDAYMNAQGFLLVFSITSRASLNELHGLQEEIQRIKGRDQFPIVIVGNKADLQDQREVPRTRAIAVSRDLGVQYYETSARTGTNIDEAIYCICRHMLRIDDEIEAMDEETFETKYKYDTSRQRRRLKEKGNHPKCVIL